MLKLAAEGKKGKSNKVGTKKEEQDDKKEDLKEDISEQQEERAEEDEDEVPEIPNIEPNGVCIELDRKSDGNATAVAAAAAAAAANKPHTRHSAAVQQQALSV